MSQFRYYALRTNGRTDGCSVMFILFLALQKSSLINAKIWADGGTDRAILIRNFRQRGCPKKCIYRLGAPVLSCDFCKLFKTVF